MSTCFFCDQPQVESKVFYGPDIIEVCQEHEDNLDQLYTGIECYFDDLSKNYTVAVVRSSQLKVGDVTHWQQYLVYVKAIKKRNFSCNETVYDITYGLLGCCSRDHYTCFVICCPVDKWYHETSRLSDELCIKLIEKPSELE